MAVPPRTAGSVLQFHRQLKAGAPAAAPPATSANAWGTTGDKGHRDEENRTGNFSGHNPHDFPGWGLQIVTAGDIPDVPALGLDARNVLDDVRRSHDDRVLYGISHGQMFSSYPAGGVPAWTWRPYKGPGHFDHGHLSVVWDARADDTRPWQTIGGDMELSDTVNLPAAYPAAGKTATVGQIFGYVNGRVINIEATVTALTSLVGELAGQVGKLAQGLTGLANGQNELATVVAQLARLVDELHTGGVVLETRTGTIEAGMVELLDRVDAGMGMSREELTAIVREELPGAVVTAIREWFGDPPAATRPAPDPAG